VIAVDTFFAVSATLVAVIVAVPGALAVTTPESLTVATAGALDRHVTVLGSPASGVSASWSRCDPVAITVADAGVTLIARTPGT
jgi:hypothetical protein